ncbi:hypothetical protein Y1Q_0022778 [Alligator mississippiensis]|uniref:Protein CUSTOS n=1 Tax=Alligator mississippiensis TaxID=8496 RepID=A0A151N4G5_ALLMI|nr:hypothetical protein Y1Q_0022778 [Alligator mississippiensis]
MAAPTSGRGAGGSDSESGSSAEDWERFREAAWDPAGQRAATGRPEPSSGGLRTDKLPSAQPSLRQRVNDHDQDGNELQTTPEFRAHVAKKLGAMLDSCITVLEGSPRCGWISIQAADFEDDGFRLFSSSVPGDCGKSEPSHSARRQRTSSSSELDSDQEWQRCQEAAVSAADILKQSALPGVSHDYNQAQNQECTEHNQKKKKKKMKKKVKGESDNDQQTPEAVRWSGWMKGTERLTAKGQWIRSEHICDKLILVEMGAENQFCFTSLVTSCQNQQMNTSIQ